MTSDRVSVLIVTRGEPPARLARAFAAVRAQDYDGPVEVLVAAPAEEHPMVAALDAGDVDVRLVANPGGARSAGLNRALAQARGVVVARVDARSVPPPDYLRACVARLQADPAVGVVGARQRPVAGQGSATAEGIARALRNPVLLGGARYRRPGASGPADTAYLGAFRTDELRALGGYDERLEANEDFDLCARYRAAGWWVWVEAGLTVDYEPRVSHAQLWRQYERFGEAKVTYWRVTGGRPNGRQAIALAVAAAGTLGAAGLARRPRRAAAVGFGALAGIAVLDHLVAPDERTLRVRAAAVSASVTFLAAWCVGVARGLGTRRGYN
jgi:cellulose synthase/poly-beta-1,6-N-acetylglucosamine synthase-like glycosyltransferase